MRILKILTLVEEREKGSPSAEDWVSEARSRCAVEYDAATKRKGVLTPAAAWRSLEHVTLSDTSQTEGPGVDESLPLPEVLPQSDWQRREAERWLPGTGEASGGVVVSWGRSSCLGRWESSETGGGDRCTEMQVLSDATEMHAPGLKPSTLCCVHPSPRRSRPLGVSVDSE
ncbi:hypothetical protein HJG60_010758 [Phyllostomus discolor]|uniref:Uncharacterized protein n=1 Tax=Phyllostomus discolor TaxID=89673 RepID=A0A834AEF4_9CHIR|nr:hypothetical protein HJG60_010758 [Phyllostomus discolor]